MLENVLALMDEWKPVFAQERTAYRAMRQALSSACVLGRRTIARSIAVRERGEDEGTDWSADYRLHARSRWAEQDLFTPALRAGIFSIHRGDTSLSRIVYFDGLLEPRK